MRLALLLLSGLFALQVSAQEKKSFTVYFEFDNELPESQSLKNLISAVEQMPVEYITSIIVHGHTDIIGSDDYNLELSEKRARTIAGILREKFKSAAVQVNFSGKQQPITNTADNQFRNRRVEISFIIMPFKEPEIELQTFYTDVEEQSFAINLDDTIRIKGKEGTSIKIAPGSLLYRDGKLMTGHALLKLKEYYQPADILMAGLHTTNNNGMLGTGGMIKIFVIKGEDTASKRLAKNMEIRMPVQGDAYENMQVYKMDDPGDEAWEDTKDDFLVKHSLWDWESSKEIEELVDIYKGIKYEEFRNGGKMKFEHYFSRELFQRRRYVPLAKKVKGEMYKKDSSQLEINASFRYRKLGRKLLGKTTLDTVFTVNYIQKEYIAKSQEFNFINCDRFLNYDEVITYKVSTPSFRGMTVMLYFPSERAFMNSDFDNGYRFSRLPKDKPVYVIAFGNNGDDYYYGDLFTSTGPGVASLNLSKIDKNEIKSRLKALK